MFRLPAVPPVQNARTRRGGSVNSTVTITQKDKAGNEQEIGHFGQDTKPVAKAITGAHGMSGVGFGLTIPGPEKSYMAARIDAFCYLPHDPTVEAARAAMDQASELVQERLEKEAKEVDEFFSSYRRK